MAAQPAAGTEGNNLFEVERIIAKRIVSELLFVCASTYPAAAGTILGAVEGSAT